MAQDAGPTRKTNGSLGYCLLVVRIDSVGVPGVLCATRTARLVAWTEPDRLDDPCGIEHNSDVEQRACHLESGVGVARLPCGRSWCDLVQKWYGNEAVDGNISSGFCYLRIRHGKHRL